jgi:hypothetical protein
LSRCELGHPSVSTFVLAKKTLRFVAPYCADMIRDNDPLTNRYISVPRDYSPLNCASYIGGIVRGALDAADFVRISINVGVFLN